MNQPPPWGPPGQYQPQPPYPQQPYAQPPPQWQQPYPPPQHRQPMKPYTFRAGGLAVVTIRDDGVMLPPAFSDWTLKRVRWDRADVAAVSVEPHPRRNRACEVAITRRDGKLRRYRRVQAAAAEVASAFGVRGYPLPR